MSESGVLHIRVNGRSEDVSLERLNLSATASDTAVREALGAYLDKPATHFDEFVIVREGRNLTVRPEAVFGAE